MSYSDESNMDNGLVEVSIFDVQEGQSVLHEGKWYKALEDSHVENGFVGFKAEDEEFKEVVIEFRKNDLGYASPLHMEREIPTAEEPTTDE